MPAFHDGEIALQQRAGTFARLQEVGPRVIRDHMPDQHREFFRQLPFVLVGSVDASGQPHASVLAGPPGFMRSPQPRMLRIDARPLPHDPLVLRAGMGIGLLGIEPHTRRRNRMNGTVTAVDDEGFGVEVGQSFGNCPKYIVPRQGSFAAVSGAASVTRGDTLDAETRRMVARADTFFIATAHASGVDVSHRGGPAGFVKLESERLLAVPDFVGNGFFNTLGNLQLEPRCGLLFIDFESGDLLYLAARAQLDWRGDERVLRLEVIDSVRSSGALPVMFT